MKMTDNEQAEKPTAVNTGTGSEPPAASLVEQANKAGERLEKGLAELKQREARLEELEARRRLGGVTEAGQPIKKEEVDPKAYAQNALKGVIK